MTDMADEIEKYTHNLEGAAEAFKRISQEPLFIIEGQLAARTGGLEYDLFLRNNTGFGDAWRDLIFTATNATYGYIHKDVDFVLSKSNIAPITRSAKERIVALGFEATSSIYNAYLDEFRGLSIPYRTRKRIVVPPPRHDTEPPLLIA